MTISIGLIENHPVLRSALGVLLGSTGFTVVAEGAGATDAHVISTRHTPDIMLVDHIFPTLFDVAARAKVVVFAASAVIEQAVLALDAGASGYILKTSSSDDLVRGLKAVHAGDTYISHDFASKVVVALRNTAVRKLAADAIKLSVREQQIVRLLLSGRTNKEIARDLSLCEATVKHYMSALMQKLNARNRLEVVIAAQKMANGTQSLPT